VDAVLVVIVILALGGGAALLLARQGALPASLPSLRPSGGAVDSIDAVEDDPEAVSGPTRDRMPPTPALTAASIAPKLAPIAAGAAQEPVRLNLVPTPGDIGLARHDSIEGRGEQRQRAVGRQHV
jgi:hypothetical protein